MDETKKRDMKQLWLLGVSFGGLLGVGIFFWAEAIGGLVFFGSLLQVFGPGLVFSGIYLARTPQLVLLSVGSGFFFILSQCVAALWWKAVVPFQNKFWAWHVIWGVIIQEAFRVLYYFILLEFINLYSLLI